MCIPDGFVQPGVHSHISEIEDIIWCIAYPFLDSQDSYFLGELTI